MWIVAEMTDGPLQGRRFEIEDIKSHPPRELDLSNTDGAVYTYRLAGASKVARRWHYCYRADPAK